MPLRALFFRRAAEPERFDLRFDGAVYAVRVKRHAQARRYTLRIQAATHEVVLTMPPRGNLRDARAFAERHGGWIAARLNRLPKPAPFADGALVPIRGIDHRIALRGSARGVTATEIDADGVHLLRVSGDTPHLERRVTDFLKREAKRDLEAAAHHYATTLGVMIARISIRDQASRWGSCSSTGVLSFSWRLILAPPFVLDYLAAHEVAHLVEMNHSRRFWRLVLRICPDAHRAKTWLDAHGAGLHRYGLQTDARPDANDADDLD
jgi:predicted metal-dependent hydrolase